MKAGNSTRSATGLGCTDLCISSRIVIRASASSPTLDGVRTFPEQPGLGAGIGGIGRARARRPIGGFPAASIRCA